MTTPTKAAHDIVEYTIGTIVLVQSGVVSMEHARNRSHAMAKKILEDEMQPLREAAEPFVAAFERAKWGSEDRRLEADLHSPA